MAVGKITRNDTFICECHFFVVPFTALQQPAAEVYQRMKRVNISESFFYIRADDKFWRVAQPSGKTSRAKKRKET